MPQLTQYETLALQKLGEAIQQGKCSNDVLVQLIELSGDYLNLMTIPNYAKTRNLSYNVVKKTSHIRKIFETKFIIDNDLIY